MSNIKKFFSVSCAVFALSGCVAPTHDGFLPKGYQFNSQSKQGLLAFSSSCDMYKGDINLIFADQNQISHYIPIKCNDPADGLSKPELRMLALSPGRYHLDRFHVMLTSGQYLVPQEFHKFYFDVKPGVVNYLGWLQFRDEYADHFYMKAVDVRSRDVRWMKETIPGINARVVFQAFSKNP